MVNKQVFNDTYQFFDKSIIVEIIDIFMEEGPGKIAAIEQNIEEANFDKLRFNAHSLKGVVANFSAPQAFEKVKELEKMAAGLVEGNEFDQNKMLAGLATIKTMVHEMMDDLDKIKEEYA